MPDYKVQGFFNLGDEGWTETYYWSHPTLGEGDLREDIALMEKARRAILGADVSLLGWRYTDISPVVLLPFQAKPLQRPSVLWRNVLAGTQIGLSGLSSVDPWSAFLINLYDLGDVYRRTLMLRGVPSDWHSWSPNNPINPDPHPTFLQKLKIFLGTLGVKFAPATPADTSRWKLLGRQRSTLAAAKVPIQTVSVVSDTDNHYVITQGDVVPYNLGDVIHVHGVNACTAKGINGDSVVIAKSTPGPGILRLVLHKTQCCEGEIEYDGKGTTYKVLRTVYAAISKGSFGRWVSRKTGRAFFVTRGRQPKRCCG